MADVLAELMARRGYGRNQSQQALSLAWREITAEVLPQHRSLNSHVAAIRGGTLEVILENSTLVQELQFQKHLLLAALKQRLPDHRLRDLRFRVGAVAADGNAATSHQS